MTAVDLSRIPLRRATPRFLDFGYELRPPGAGAIQRINKLGSRYALTVEGPPIPEEPDGRLATSLLRQAKQLGASFPWPQPGLAIGAPGTPVVDGPVEAGTSIPVTGGTPHYAIRQGQFFNLIHDGVRYLHEAAAALILDASGEGELVIFPALRVSLDDADALDFAQVRIEGLLESGDFAWSIMTEPFTGLETFTIEEVE